MLNLLKIDLGIRTDAYDERLGQYLLAAADAIKREGVTLKDTVGDRQLQVMYAAWLFRNRDSMAGMPRMLRYALNNRLLSEKAQTAE